MPPKVTSSSVRLHGHDIAYRTAGDHPDVIVLVHGIAGSSSTWTDVISQLAEHHTVLAPDLLGHGDSDKPRTDYSLGAYANLLRDLMFVLGHERATIVGHSLGGGVAMQMAYQYPEHCERLVLVSSGGLGKEVSPVLRALTLPGSEYVLALLLTRQLHTVVSDVAGQFRRLGLRGSRMVEEVWGSWRRLTDVRTQRAFVHTIRSVIDAAGQRVSARDRLYLTAEMPTLLMWGDRDRIIPVDHAHVAHRLMPGSRLEIFEGCGHFLSVEEPERFVEVLDDFIATTEPARVDRGAWRTLLAPGPNGPDVLVERA